MKRKDCFFGLHFDFHANENTRDVGKNLDENVIEKIVTTVKPDFIQCDTKGHPGYASYKTKIGNVAPHLKKDLLSAWRKVTEKHGVLLFSHYSGIWDKKVAKEHPEMALYYENGEKSDTASIFGEYADKILIPQLKELALDYGVDGAWVDGECWALGCDYGEFGKRAFKKKTGKDIGKLDDEVLRFTRESFFEYVNHYVTQVKKVAPDFEITSNWLNTAIVPDTVNITDYISGDLSATNSVSSARFDGRIMQSFGRNWDIMSWGISFPVHYVKSAVQLCQEASIITSLGGGFQIYNMQSPQNTVMDEWAISEWAKVAEFCRKRQAYCQYSKIVPDVGVIYSSKSYYSELHDSIFDRGSEYSTQYYGMLLAFSDLGHSVSTVMAERKELSFDEYKTLVVTDAEYIEEDLKQKLLKYAEKGGRLILCGKKTAELFAEDLGYRVRKPINEKPIATVFGKDFTLESRYPYAVLDVENAEDVIYMAENIVDGDLDQFNPPPSIMQGDDKVPAFFTQKYGKGKIGVITLSFGRTYLNERTWELQELVKDCFESVGKSAVSTDKYGQVEVLLTEKDGRRFINVTNLLGEHENAVIKTFRTIPELLNVKIILDAESKVKCVKSVLSGEELKVRETDGGTEFTVPKLEINDIFEII